MAPRSSPPFSTGRSTRTRCFPRTAPSEVEGPTWESSTRTVAAIRPVWEKARR